MFRLADKLSGIGTLPGCKHIVLGRQNQYRPPSISRVLGDEQQRGGVYYACS